VCQRYLPLFFVIEYAGWLWFFGHNMHPWGAFTVKPFMPTLFGEGKVAQFSTYSYPYWGYGLLMVTFACLTVAMLVAAQTTARDKRATDMAGGKCHVVPALAAGGAVGGWCWRKASSDVVGQGETSGKLGATADLSTAPRVTMDRPKPTFMLSERHKPSARPQAFSGFGGRST
jgi:hypothetical protein